MKLYSKDAIKKKYPLLAAWYTGRIKFTLKSKPEDKQWYLECSNPSLEEIRNRNRDGYSVFFFPNGSNQSGSKFTGKTHVQNINWLFVDMDLKDKIYTSKEEFIFKLDEFMSPTILVDSGNGIHAYWSFNQFPRSRFEDYQQRLIQHLKTDSSVWPLSQAMRLPLTYNTKEGWDKRIKVKIIAYNPKAVYEKDDFSNLPPLPPSKKGKKGRPKKAITFKAEVLNDMVPDFL